MNSRYTPESLIGNESVDKEMGGSLNWVNSPILEDDDTEFSATFCEYPEESALEVRRLCERVDVENDDKLSSHYWYEEICDGGELNRLAVRLSYPILFSSD
jgi:hypothetical protein